MSGLARKLRRKRQRLDNERGQRLINGTPLTAVESLFDVPVRRRIAGIHRPDGIDEDISQPVKPDKGLKGGSCNRTACQAPSANWFNHSTRAYYCGHCARILNEANRHDDWIKRLGHDLCTLDLAEGEVGEPIGSHSHA